MSKEKKTPDSEEMELAKRNFLEKMKEAFLQEYEPAKKFTAETITMTTREIFYQMQLLFPSKTYQEDDVVIFLDTAGFTTVMMAPMRWEWLLLPKTPQN